MNRKKNSFLKSSAGFSLMEVTVAAGLLGVVSLGIMRLSSSLVKTSRSANQSASINSIRMEVFNNLNNKTACDLTFAAHNFGPGVNNAGNTSALPAILKADGTPVIQAGQDYQIGDGASVDAKTKINITSIYTMDYEANGNPYRDSTADAAENRLTANAKVVIEYKRGGRVGGSANNTDDIEKEKTLGGINGRLAFPIKISHVSDPGAASGAFVACSNSSNAYVEALCESLQGVINTDGYCRHVTITDEHSSISNPNAPGEDGDTWAARVRGTMLVENSAANANKNDLRVQGSMDIGFIDGTIAPPGMADEATDGELRIANSFVVGQSDPPDAATMGAANGGVAKIDHSLTIGQGLDAEADAQLGKLRAESSLVVGDAGFLNGNDIYSNANVGRGNSAFQGSVAVGDGAMSAEILADDGRMNILNHLAVGNPASVNGATMNDDSLSGIIMARGLVVGDNSDGAVEMRAGDISNYSAVFMDNIYLPNVPNNYVASTTEQQQYVATMGWVGHKISNTITPAVESGRVSDVYTDILQSADPADAGFTAICLGLYGRNGDLVTDQKGSYGAGRCEIAIKHCSDSSECVTVYAGSGGVESEGDIITVGGDIVAQSGNIEASNNITAGGNVTGETLNATSRICFNGASCKSNWEDITIRTGSCLSSTTGACPSGYFIKSASLDKSQVTYVSGMTSQKYDGRVTSVSPTTSNVDVATAIRYVCCKAENQNN